MITDATVLCEPELICVDRHDPLSTISACVRCQRRHLMVLIIGNFSILANADWVLQ